MNEERIERLKIECLEKELEYWTLKVGIAKLEKEMHEKASELVKDDLDFLLKEGIDYLKTKNINEN